MPTPYSKILLVSGPDAGKFLQGQLSCDVLALANGQSSFGAYCNVKGKVDCFFRITRLDDTYQLCMPDEMLATTMQELKKYAMFSKVQISELDSTTPIDECNEIGQKIPEVYASTAGLFFPHDLNLPEIGAVSFSKGCYRGQEIVARMQHRGNIKRSLYAFNCASNDLQPGDEINSSDTSAGTIVRVTAQANDQQIGLAVISNSCMQQKLFVKNISIELDPA